MMREAVVSAPVLNAIMSNFQPEFIAKRAVQFAEMVRDCEETGMPKYKLYASLGQCVISADPPQKDRLNLLNTVGGCGHGVGVTWLVDGCGMVGECDHKVM